MEEYHLHILLPSRTFAHLVNFLFIYYPIINFQTVQQNKKTTENVSIDEFDTAYSLDSMFRQNGVKIEVSRFDGQRWDREAVKEDKRKRERERGRARKKTSSFGSIEALWAINNAECWAPISQVDSVPARTFYSDLVYKERKRERERNSSSIGQYLRVSRSTMANGLVWALVVFTVTPWRRGVESEGVWENAYRCDYARFGRGRLHNLLTSMENKSSPRNHLPFQLWNFLPFYPDRRKYKQIVDHLGTIDVVA